jgi:hypothetical protein
MQGISLKQAARDLKMATAMKEGPQAKLELHWQVVHAIWQQAWTERSSDRRGQVT